MCTYKRNLFKVSNFLDDKVKVDNEETSSVDVPCSDDNNDISDLIDDGQDAAFDRPKFTDFGHTSPLNRIGKINMNDFASRYCKSQSGNNIESDSNL